MNERLIAMLMYGVLFTAGYAVLDLFFKKTMSLGEKIGLSFAIGTCIYVALMLVMFFLNVPWNIFLVLILFIGITVVGISRVSLASLRFRLKFKLNLSQTCLLSLIIVSVGFSVAESLLHPLIAWDGIASWFMGARGIIINKTILPQFYPLMNFDFPPALHLLIAYPSFLLGKFSESGGMIMFNFVSVSTAILFFSMLRKKTSLTYSLLFTFLYVSTQNVVRHSGYLDVGHVDIVLSYFVLCSVFFVSRIVPGKSPITVLFYSLILAVISLSKTEGLPYAIISLFVVVAFLVKQKSYKTIVWFTPGVVIMFLWFTFKFLYLPGTPFLIHQLPHFSQAPRILLVMGKEFINIARWNFGWIFIILVIPFMKREKDILIIMIIGLLQMVAFFGAYLVSFIDPVIHAQTSFDRLILQLYPLFLYLAALTFVRRIRRKNTIQ